MKVEYLKEAKHAEQETDVRESRYAEPKRTPKQLGLWIRKGIIAIFPQWDSRVKVAVGLTGDVANSIAVSLRTFDMKNNLHKNVSKVGKIIQNATGRNIKYHRSHIDYQNYHVQDVRYYLETPDLQEAKYSEPSINKAGLKRMYREVQELIGGELDTYESRENVYVLNNMEMFFDDVEKVLTKKYGEAEKFNIPEFTVPWFKYTVGDFWIMLKSYTGAAQVEILPARIRGTYLQEARYAEPDVKRLKGVLYVDDDQRNEWIKHRHVKMSVRCDSSATTKGEYSHSYDCEIVSTDNPSTLIDIKPGDRAWFTRDKRGWALLSNDGKWNLSDR